MGFTDLLITVIGFGLFLASVVGISSCVVGLLLINQRTRKKNSSKG